jgi:tape measure domain-containing protein
MPTSDEVVTRYTLDPSGYTRGAKEVSAADRRIAQSNRRTKTSFRDLGSQLSSGWDKGRRAIDAFVSAYAGLTAAGAAAGFFMMRQAAEYDALVAALTAVEGSADKAAGALKRVREIAKAPGLGLEEAIGGYTQLRRSGLSQKMSEDLLREFGNANAMAGGGKDQLSRLMLAATQISNKPFLQGDEMLQLTEGGIPAHKIIKEAFGTSDPAELKKAGVASKQVLAELVRVLERTPRVAGGAKNTFENVADALNHVAVIGGQAFNGALLPYVEQFTKAVEDLTDSGVLQAGFQSLADSLSSVFGDGLGEVQPMLIETMGNLVTVAAIWRNVTLNIKGFAEWMYEITDRIRILDPKARERNRKRDRGEPVTISDYFSGGGIDPFSEGQSTKDYLHQRWELAKKRGKKDAGLPSDEMDPDTDDHAKSFREYLEKIAENTLKTADNTKKDYDAGMHVAGGGDLARMGVTPLERGSYRSDSVGKALRDLERAIFEMHDRTIGASLVAVRRQGAF